LCVAVLPAVVVTAEVAQPTVHLLEKDDHSLDFPPERPSYP